MPVGHCLEKLLEIPEDLSLNLEKIRQEIKEMPIAQENGISQLDEFADFVYASLRFSEAASENIARATKGNAWQVNQDNAPPGHFSDSAFNYTLNELTIRAVQAMQRYAKAFAWLNGDAEASEKQLKTVLPYLLWHKVQPSQKALTENQIYENDRIAFVQWLIEKIETEYNELKDNKVARETYTSALRAIEEGKIAEKDLTGDEIRHLTRAAVYQIGNIDKSWAIMLANHLASAYNSRFNEKKSKNEEKSKEKEK